MSTLLQAAAGRCSAASRSPPCCCSSSRPRCCRAFRLDLLAKYLCFAIVAVGIGLAWGRGGMLTLGQGVFFGLGAYVMAMHLKLADAGPGGMPDFMVLTASDGCPRWWEPFRDPGLDAAGDPAAARAGRRPARPRGRSAAGSGRLLRDPVARPWPPRSRSCSSASRPPPAAPTGLNDFQGFFGYNLYDPVNKQMLFFIAAGVLLAMVALARQLMCSRYGELLVAVPRRRGAGALPRLRPGERQDRRLRRRGRAWRASAGALFVPIVGIISPGRLGIVPSIGFVIGVAVGGRATLLGPVLGAIAVAWAQTTLSRDVPVGLDLLPGRCCSCWSSRSCRAGSRRCAACGGGLRARLRRPAAAEPRRRSTRPTVAAPDGRRRHERPTTWRSATCTVVLRRLRRRRRRGPDGARPATCGSSSGPTAPARPRWSTPSPGWSRPPGRSGSAGTSCVGQKVHQIARLGVGRTFQTATRVRGADRAAEPRHRGGRRPRPADAAAPPAGRPRRGGRGAGDDRPDRPRATSPPGVLRARPEAVAGDRHAARAGRAAAAARRAGRRDEPRGAGRDRRAAAAHRRGPHGGRRRARHGLPARFAAVGDRAARGRCSARARVAEVQADPTRAGGLPRAAGTTARTRSRRCWARRASDAADARRRRSATGARRCCTASTVEVPAGRGRRRDGPQRRGQDDAAAGRGRAAAGAAGRILLDGEDVTAARARTSGCGAGWPTCRRASSRSGS